MHFKLKHESVPLDTEPDVVPLSHLGAAPQDISLLSSQELLLHALVNMLSEGGYAV